MNVGKQAVVTDEGYCFSYFEKFAKDMGYPEAVGNRSALDNSDEVTIIAEGTHPDNGLTNPGPYGGIIDYGKMFIVQKGEDKYIISEKGLRIDGH